MSHAHHEINPFTASAISRNFLKSIVRAYAEAPAIIIKENERLDDLQRNGLQIIQKTDGFCFGMDAVLLSGFAAVKPGERALDLGTGTGIIPLLLSAKTEGEHFSALEIQDEIARMAERSIK